MKVQRGACVDRVPLYYSYKELVRLNYRLETIQFRYMKEDFETSLLHKFVKSLGLSQETSEYFCKFGKLVHLAKGESFVVQGYPCKYLGAVLAGNFRFQYCDEEGNARTVGFNSNGFITEYYSLLKSTPAKYSVIAITDAIIFRFSRQQVLDFYELNMETQRFGRHIAEQLFFHRDSLLFAFRCDSVEMRYKKLIETVDFKMNYLSLKDMAYLIGVTPETISRLRRKLHKSDDS